MGIASAPGIFHKIMNRVLEYWDYVTVYINDILIIQKEDEFDDSHLEKLAIILGFAQNIWIWS